MRYLRPSRHGGPFLIAFGKAPASKKSMPCDKDFAPFAYGFRPAHKASVDRGKTLPLLAMMSRAFGAVFERAMTDDAFGQSLLRDQAYKDFKYVSAAANTAVLVEGTRRTQQDASISCRSA